MRTSFACDLETMERLASFERDYQERYFLPVDSARRAAIHREHENRCCSTDRAGAFDQQVTDNTV